MTNDRLRLRRGRLMHWDQWPAVLLIFGAPTAAVVTLVALAVHDLLTGRHYGD